MSDPVKIAVLHIGTKKVMRDDDDILERLRSKPAFWCSWEWIEKCWADAADEIEQLRGQLK